MQIASILVSIVAPFDNHIANGGDKLLGNASSIKKRPRRRECRDRDGRRDGERDHLRHAHGRGEPAQVDGLSPEYVHQPGRCGDGGAELPRARV